MQASEAPKGFYRAKGRPEEAPTWPQQCIKMGPRRTQDGKKAIPNHKTTREPNQDDFKTVADPQPADLHSSAASPGLHLGGQNGTKTDPKTIKNRSDKSRGKKHRSKTILEPSWGDLGPSWVPSWADLDLKIVLSPSVALIFLKNDFFDVKTVRRRSWDQL